jgi:hypothetical protein
LLECRNLRPLQQPTAKEQHTRAVGAPSPQHRPEMVSLPVNGQKPMS